MGLTPEIRKSLEEKLTVEIKNFFEDYGYGDTTLEQCRDDITSLAKSLVVIVEEESERTTKEFMSSLSAKLAGKLTGHQEKKN